MIGSTLSHYRIDAELGRGGMGIVYRAQDTKLNREVALKILPSAALATEDDRARFYREAQAAAQLHHPNIATIFEIDEAVPSDAPHGTQPSPFIAMEFIEGETLDDHIKKGPMKLEEAIRIASEIGGALEEAHEKDIVHRDVKSANVMLTSKGVAKVLDFGLAKTAQSTKLTRMGSTLGTVAYMSPEQARGEEVDSRTDIWALGVVLYEMCSGRNPFGGDYEQAVVYGILNEDPPPLTGIRTGFPMGLEWIIGKCLAKNAADRYQRAEDLLVDLRTVDLSPTGGMSRVSTGSVSAMPIQDSESMQERTISWETAAMVGALALIVGVLGTILLIPAPEPVVRKFEQSFAGLATSRISHAGDRVVYTQNDSLFVRNLNSLTPQVISTEASSGGLWSPDDSEILFLSGPDAWIVSSTGGEAVRLTDFGLMRITGATWMESEDIYLSVLAGTAYGEIRKVPSTGGPFEIYMGPDDIEGGKSFLRLSHIPGTEKIIALVINDEQIADIWLLADNNNILLLHDRSLFITGVHVTPEGFLLVTHRTGIWRYELAKDHRSLVGNPVRVAPPGAIDPSVAEDGTFSYVQLDPVPFQSGWISDSGEPGESFGQPSISAGGLLVHPSEDRLVSDANQNSMWMLTNRGSESPLPTEYDRTDMANDWLRDGQRLLFSSFRTGGGDIYVIDAFGNQPPEIVLHDESPLWASSVSADNKFLAF